MTRARARAFAILAAVLIAAAVAAAVIGREPRALGPRPESQRPVLLLLTSLPLVFPEAFALGGGGSAALTALRTRYRVIPISTTDEADLARGRLLLMAHPPAQTAENLVALDSWVRRGGRVILLADPMLEWPSERPLGDPLRPSPMFMDTGLLGHWGLRLDAPDRRGPAARKLADRQILTNSPGQLVGDCEISADAFVARCPIVLGRAEVVADADFLDPRHLGEGAEQNLDALLAELATIEGS